MCAASSAFSDEYHSIHLSPTTSPWGMGGRGRSEIVGDDGPAATNLRVRDLWVFAASAAVATLGMLLITQLGGLFIIWGGGGGG